MRLDQSADTATDKQWINCWMSECLFIFLLFRAMVLPWWWCCKLQISFYNCSLFYYLQANKKTILLLLATWLVIKHFTIQNVCVCVCVRIGRAITGRVGVPCCQWSGCHLKPSWRASSHLKQTRGKNPSHLTVISPPIVHTLTSAVPLCPLSPFLFFTLLCSLTPLHPSHVFLSFFLIPSLVSI